jgi:hypothetical protein
MKAADRPAVAGTMRIVDIKHLADDFLYVVFGVSKSL